MTGYEYYSRTPFLTAFFFSELCGKVLDSEASFALPDGVKMEIDGGDASELFRNTVLHIFAKDVLSREMPVNEDGEADEEKFWAFIVKEGGNG